MVRSITTTLITLLMVSMVSAQNRPDPGNPENANLEVPANWEVRLDDPDQDVNISSNEEQADIYFVNMVPGWHITTGPAAIFWHPASTAKGSYRAETVIHLFDPQGRNEAFGIFFGGKNLKAEDQSYSYFLLRNSGEYLIKNRSGSETSIVQNWSLAPSMNTYSDSTESSVRNQLAVEVTGDSATFFVNDEEVATIPTSQLNIDGIVGLRVNHRLNVHVEDLAVDLGD